MQYAILSIVAGLCFFFAYRRGIQDGIALSNNKTLSAIKTPVAMYQEHIESKEAKKEAKKEAEKQGEELTEIVGYTRETALEAIKKAR